MLLPFTLNCNGKLISLGIPKVMGILNITEDSFFDGGKHHTIEKALERCEKMISEGADIIDVGGQSSRPNAKMLASEEELQIVKPIAEALTQHFPHTVFSIDTFWSEVAKMAVENGFSIVNDISAGSIDHDLLPTIAKLQVPYILMHMQGNPQNMQQNPAYKDVVYEINFFFSEKIQWLKQLGINDIVLDVGFGFGKNTEHNYTLLKNLNSIEKVQDFPLLVGISRKSMIYNTLNNNAENALNGTTALNMIALQNGAKILRVHDVKEAKECVILHQKLQEYD